MKYFSGFWVRTAALLIDVIILIIPILFFISLGYGFIGIIISWLYFAIMESSSLQATLGKKALGIRVVDSNFNRINFIRATVRYFCKYISSAIFFMGYIMITFTNKKQGYHDLVANTMVMNKHYQDMQFKEDDAKKDTELIEKKLLEINFNAILLMVIFVLMPINLIFALVGRNLISYPYIVIFTIFSVFVLITGIGLYKGKVWTFWSSIAIFSYMLVSIIVLMFTLRIAFYEKIGFLPYLGLFILSIYLMYRNECLKYFKLDKLSRAKLYLFPVVTLLLSTMFYIGKSIIGF